MSCTTKRLHIIYGDLTLGLAGEGFHVLFNYVRGGIESITKEGREWIYRTPKPTFWRAATDNDRGCGFHLRSGMWLSADMFLRTVDTRVYVDGKAIEKPIGPENNRYTNAEYADNVALTFTYETITVPATLVHVTYDVHADGRIVVTAKYEGKKGLPQLPAFGLRFIMPTKATGFTYEGLSGETYPDRKKGGKPGVYEVEGLPVTPHLVPQECGMHMDTKWLEVRRNTALSNVKNQPGETALRFVMADQPFAFSCLPYTSEELENALHQEELPPQRRTVLCIFGEVRGVGGIDTWGSDVESAYHISAEEDHEFSFVIEL